MFTKAFVLASVAALASAATYDVTVGGLNPDGTPLLKFQPEFVNAAVGDVVTFTFKQKAHSVVETSFNSVCHPDGNLDTGLMPVANDATTFPTFNYTVQDASKPLWFYCGQTGHCGKGMIFSINCPTTGTNSLDAFRESALRFGQQEAAASSWAATASSDVYGGHTYAPVYAPTVTQTVTTGDAVWTTTYQSYQNSPDPTPDVSGPQTHTINVGADQGLTFNPANITAKPRDIVRFVFLAKNHTATQSAFRQPCLPLEDSTDPAQEGFDSGFIPGKADGSAFYEITVNDTAPIWVYCKQGNHCGSGMVFSVNADPTSPRSHDAFKNLASVLNGTGGTGGNGGNGGTTDSNGAAFTSTSVVGGLAGLALAGVASTFALLL